MDYCSSPIWLDFFIFDQNLLEKKKVLDGCEPWLSPNMAGVSGHCQVHQTSSMLVVLPHHYSPSVSWAIASF